MPLSITSCIRTSAQMHVGQKGTASRVVEEYLLEFAGGTGDGSQATLKDCDALTYTASAPPHDTTKPVIRDRYADDARFVCTAITYKNKSVCTWTMQVEYSAMLNDGLYSDEVVPPMWCRMARRCSFRMVPFYKFTTTFPTSYSTAWPPTTAVTGTSVDIMGQPEQYRVWHHTFEIEIHIDRAYAMAYYSSAQYFALDWNTKLFKRNNAAFFGYPTGTCVFLGYTQNLTEDPWDTYVLQFEADQIGFLEQRVLPNVTGGVLMTNSSTWASQVVKQAGTAYWYQPYSRLTTSAALTDFYLLAPDGAFDELVHPSPAWVP